MSPDAVVSVRNTPTIEQLSVHYQVAEGGRKVYYQVLDENTGEVVRQLPPTQVVSSEEHLFEFLQKQNKPAAAG